MSTKISIENQGRDGHAVMRTGATLARCAKGTDAKALAAAFRAAAKVHGEGTVAEADAVRVALPTLAECVP